MDITLTALVGVICSILGAALAYLGFSRNKKKDDTQEGMQNGTILTEIGYIKANTDEIKAEQKEQRKVNLDVISRITAVETSAKQAHKRLDTIEGRQKGGGRDE